MGHRQSRGQREGGNDAVFMIYEILKKKERKGKKERKEGKKDQGPFFLMNLMSLQFKNKKILILVKFCIQIVRIKAILILRILQRH